MAGGTWTTQNKVRPGVYMNFKTRPQALGTLSERGIVAFPTALSWGDPGNVIKLEASEYMEKSMALIGFRATDPRIRHITAAISHANRVLLYRLGGTGAVKAAVTEGKLTATAKWVGIRGNDLKVVVQANIDNPSAFDVITLLDSEEMDRQTVSKVEELVASAYIDWSGTGTPTVTAGVPLVGGKDGSTSGADYSAALSAFERYPFNVLGIPLSDTTSKQLAAAYVRRLREDEGKKIVAVLVNHPQADYEGIISLHNGIITSDGLQIPPEMLVFEIAAMQSAANVNKSLTYAAIPNAVNASPRLSDSEIISALKNGEMVIVERGGKALIEQDINTLTSFTPTKGKQFAKNRVIRVLDSLGNDFKRIFESYYIGKVNNNADGRNLFWGECVKYLNTLQEISAIQNFDGQTDVVVLPGNDSDSIVAEVNVQPVDAIEKIYMRVEVR